MSWWKQATRAVDTARKWLNQIDRASGGWVPGGGVPNPIFRRQPPSSPSSRSRAASPVVSRPASSAATVTRPAPGVNVAKSFDLPLPPRYKPRLGFPGIADEIVYQGIQGTGSLLNNASSLVNRLPGPVKDVVRDSTNLLPFSANLFSRYALGLGGKGVTAPDWMIEEINVNRKTPDLVYTALRHFKQGGSLSDFRNTSKDKPLIPKYVQQYKVLMDDLNQAIRLGSVQENEAERLRELYNRRLKEKTTMIFPHDWSNERGVLNSGQTAIGHAFLKGDGPKPAQLVDTYDFVYGGQTLKEAEALRKKGLDPVDYHTAARFFAANVVNNLLGTQEDPRISGQTTTGRNPGQAIVNFGRGVTSVMKPNDYNLTIPIPLK